MKPRTAALGGELLDELRKSLLRERRALFHAFEDVEADLRALEEERESEWVERGQEEAVARLLARLDDREKEMLEAIQRALGKIAAGAYGICEACGLPVGVERLRALPAARLCIDCERIEEETLSRRVSAETAFGRPSLPPELRDLDDAGISARVLEHLREQGGDDFREVRARCRHGIVFLSGEVASEALRGEAVQAVTDVLGLEAVDRLRVSTAPWEAAERPEPPMTVEEAREAVLGRAVPDTTPPADDEERIEPAPVRPGR